MGMTESKPPYGRTPCGVCGRLLKNPESVKRGIGPECLAKLKAKVEQATKSGQPVPPQYWEITDADIPVGPGTKLYRGYRDRGMYTPERSAVLVEANGLSRDLPHVMYHSPTGFAWGYSGSGPADLARSILADCAGIRVADMLYQRFKSDVVVRLGEKHWTITETFVRRWLERVIKEVA